MRKPNFRHLGTLHSLPVTVSLFVSPPVHLISPTVSSPAPFRSIAYRKIFKNIRIPQTSCHQFPRRRTVQVNVALQIWITSWMIYDSLYHRHGFTRVLIIVEHILPYLCSFVVRGAMEVFVYVSWVWVWELLPLLFVGSYRVLQDIKVNISLNYSSLRCLWGLRVSTSRNSEIDELVKCNWMFKELKRTVKVR